MTSGGVTSGGVTSGGVTSGGVTSGGVVIPFPGVTSGAWAEEWFGDEGLLARARPGYEKREGQIALSKAVAQALAEKRHALAEGPCGVGKSIAYLVPAIRFVQANPGKRVVIATETIALQEQLVGKDLPFLAEIAPGGFRFALAKGRAQYLCNDAFATWQAKSGRFALNEDERALLAWGRETRTGSRTSLPIAVPDRTWSKVTVDSDECKGKDCPAREVCFYEQARDAIKDAQIIVANYKLLCIHLAMAADGIDPKALPLGEFHALIADEAHGLVDVARDTFGATITEGSFAKTVNFAREYLPDGAAERLETAVGGVFGGVREWVEAHAPANDRPGYTSSAGRAEDAVRVPLDTEPSFPVDLEPLVSELERTCSRASAMEAKLSARERDQGRLDGEDREARARARSTARRVGKQLVSLALFNRGSINAEAAPDAAARLAEIAERYALWVELDRVATGERSVRLEARKVDVRDTLASLLWSEMPCVLTSATLTVEGRFDHVEQETGIGHRDERAPIRLEVPSPFDFASRCMLVLPAGIPQPNDPAWRGACAKVVGGVVDAAEGRTLALFSSTSAMDAAHRAVTEGKRNARLWLRQGEAPTGALSQTFKSNARSVLFGTKSFWTGIDVPGDSLVAVVIDRVPFTPPTDPVIRRLHALLEKRGLSGFTHCDLPRAIMQVRQAFGRLIRTRDDYGVVVLLDSRVSSARWGRALLRSLPACRRGTRLGDVRAHLDAFRARGAAEARGATTGTSNTGTEGNR
jgi:ATP-dependent DNA helicase DinG